MSSLVVPGPLSEGAKSSPTLCDPMDCSLQGSSHFPGKNTGVGCHFLLQEIFPSQGLNPGLPHCRQMLYHLSHQGSQSFYYPAKILVFQKEQTLLRKRIKLFNIMACLDFNIFLSGCLNCRLIRMLLSSNTHVSNLTPFQ